MTRPSLAALAALAATPFTAASAHAQFDSEPRIAFPQLDVAGVFDVDGDGVDEVLATERVTGAFGAYSLGLGSLGVDVRLAETVALAGGPLRSPRLADIDGDGLEDLIALAPEGSSQRLVVFYDRGGKTFEDAVPLGILAEAIDRIAMTDFDGDGDLDVILYPAADDPDLSGDSSPVEAGSIRIARNLGAGAFQDPVSIQSFPEDLRDARIVDLDQDGDLDFVAVRPASGTLVLGRNVGATLQLQAVQSSERYIEDLAVGDVNGDGLCDVVTVRRATMLGEDLVLDVYLGAANGSLVAAGLDLAPGLTLGPDVVLLDSSGNGVLDIAVLTEGPVQSETRLALLLGDGLGSFTPSAKSPLPIPATTGDLVTGDFDGDGRDELIVAVEAGPSPGSASGAGTLLLEAAQAPAAASFAGSVLPSEVRFEGPILVGETFADGLDDLITRAGPNIVQVPGAFSERGFRGPDFYVPDSQTALPLGTLLLATSLDGSGPRSDVLIAGIDASGAEAVLRFEGGSGQNPAALFAYPASRARSLQAVDWDGDGDVDLLGEAPASFGVQWWENLGSASFAAPVPLATSTSFALGQEFVTGDFNGDGVEDLAVTLAGFGGVPDSEFRWFEGLGGGALGAPQLLPQGIRGLRVADLGRDGFDDLIFQGGPFPPGALSWVPGSPAGLAGSATTLIAAAPAGQPYELFDVEGDGSLDVVFLGSDGVVCSYSQIVPLFAVFFESESTVRTQPLRDLDGQPVTDAEYALADVSGDGDLDLVVSSSQVGLVWYEVEGLGPVGASYCGPAVPNSSGQPGRILALGSNDLGRQTLRLRALDLSQDSTGFFLVSQTQTPGMPATGSTGRICLGGAIGRFIGPGEVQNSGSLSAMAIEVDLMQLPSPTGAVSAAAGSTWNFQAWHRDFAPSGLTSNFTDAVSVTF